jgi:tRNA modification GTPase
MLERLEETIVAVSSAPGFGPVGIVRLSGPDAIALADRMTRIPAGAAWPTARGPVRAEGVVLVDAQTTLPATLYRFRAPRSYTRQDIVEIHTVGSPVAVDMVRRRAVALGATPALPGEFTARAFLLGAMDLASAEAVAGVIRARTDTQLRAARRMMDGTLTEKLAAVRDDVAQLVALVEADIDFSEEPIEFISPDVLGERLEAAVGRLNGLLGRATSVERLNVVPQILLYGPPNVGKSSIMNRLSGIDRAICATAAGTTRDILSAPIRIGRAEAVLLDAAGVDTGAADPAATGDTDDRSTSPSKLRHPKAPNLSESWIDAEAQTRAAHASDRVDLVCLVVDVTTGCNEPLWSAARFGGPDQVVVAANKVDLVSSHDAARSTDTLKARGFERVCVVSARTGDGIEQLRTLLAESLASAVTTSISDSVLITDRQRTTMASAVEAMGRARKLVRNDVEAMGASDLVAFELREALEALGSVTGQVTTEDLLHQIFADFCIGK